MDQGFFLFENPVERHNFPTFGGKNHLMDYRKKYLLTQYPGKFLLAEWNRGYRDLKISYEGRLVAENVKLSSMKKGVTVQDAQLGSVQLKLSEKPILLDIIVDGYHSPGNVSHPSKQLKTMSFVGWVAAGLFVIKWLLEGFTFVMVPVILIYDLLAFACLAMYIVCSIQIRNGKPWAFFGIYTLLYAGLLLQCLVSFGGLMMIFLLFRTVIMVYLAIGLKTAIQAARHGKFKVDLDSDLLDENVSAGT